MVTWKTSALVWLRYLLIIAWGGGLAWYAYFQVRWRQRYSQGPFELFVFPAFCLLNLLYLVFSTPWPRSLQRPRVFRLIGLWLDMKENELRQRIDGKPQSK